MTDKETKPCDPYRPNDDATEATTTFRGLVDGYCEAVLSEIGKEWTPYSLSSLKELEAVLLLHSGTCFSDEPTFFISLGVYLGEVIRRQLGDRCWWTMEQDQPVLIVAGTKQTLHLMPVTRIAKTLRDPDYGLEVFAKVAIAIANGQAI